MVSMNGFWFRTITVFTLSIWTPQLLTILVLKFEQVYFTARCCLKLLDEWQTVDTDEMPRSVASHLGLHSLLRPVCPNTYGKYGISGLDTPFSWCSANVTETGLQFRGIA